MLFCYSDWFFNHKILEKMQKCLYFIWMGWVQETWLPTFVFDGRNVVDCDILPVIGVIVHSIGKQLDHWFDDMHNMAWNIISLMFFYFYHNFTWYFVVFHSSCYNWLWNIEKWRHYVFLCKRLMSIYINALDYSLNMLLSHICECLGIYQMKRKLNNTKFVLDGFSSDLSIYSKIL